MTRTTPSTRTADNDPIAVVMSSLLPVHAALSIEWLADAAATAAERALNAPFTYVFFEDQDGRLDHKRPASDLRRRSLERASEAFGRDLFRRKLDASDAPILAEALESPTPVRATIEELAAQIAGSADAAPAVRALGVDAAYVAQLETAGERIGALLTLVHGDANPQHVRLLADHIACAAVNLRQANAAREQGVIDVVRSVFDARKLETELQRELARAVRYKREVSIVVIEATNLRLLREQFGRFLTDRLLQRLGESLAQHSREIDVIGAYKESGYTMILTEANAAGAPTAAQRLLEAARESRLDGEDVPGLELHMVAGFATCPTDGATSEALFSAVERRMYGVDGERVA